MYFKATVHLFVPGVKMWVINFLPSVVLFFGEAPLSGVLPSWSTWEPSDAFSHKHSAQVVPLRPLPFTMETRCLLKYLSTISIWFWQMLVLGCRPDPSVRLPSCHARRRLYTLLLGKQNGSFGTIMNNYLHNGVIFFLVGIIAGNSVRSLGQSNLVRVFRFLHLSWLDWFDLHY